MNSIGLFGGGFQHAFSTTLWKKPTYFDWEKNVVCDTTCFVEEAIVPNINNHKHIKKWAWVVESSPVIEKFGGVISTIQKHHKEISESYEFLISHDKSITSLESNFYYLPPHGYWIKNPQIYPKTKLCSMISSNKKMIPGHDFRLDWVRKLMGKLDMFGTGINTFNTKEETMCDYMFSVTIENSQYETYWTEKILDCFTTGTIPIYHGSPDIGEFFNLDGIIILDDTFDVSQLSADLYISKQDAIIDNFERALKYNIIEDIIWEKYLSK
jgi:hypothetical protein